MGRYPRERIEARLHLFAIDGAHRVFGVSRMPLQLHSCPSRFCDGKSGFAVMYAALSFETWIVETLVRDRFTHRLKRELPLAAVLARGYARISTQPNLELNLLDLRDTGCVDIGAPTDAVRARHSRRARRWATRCMRSTRTWTGLSMPRVSPGMIALRCLIGRWEIHGCRCVRIEGR